ncbi:MAG: hypothetical protein NC924_07930, partial [Candidatus Omnitrophica bacterium]|nr:hypothetical protein [Candidatus Omnitrophota bacterium]
MDRKTILDRQRFLAVALAGRSVKSRAAAHGGMKQRAAVFALAVFLLGGCSTIPKPQPLVSRGVNTGEYAAALSALTDNPSAYGRKNQLLYWFERGTVLHYKGDYEKSIEAFAQARREYDALYTKSVSAIASTWIWNDATAPYRGEDFELVTINIFQALNYALLGKYDEALVEARDVDSTLNAINAQYAPGQKNVYREDAFVRLLMGILYELRPLRENINDAFISD